jgi:hypothetical protein
LSQLVLQHIIDILAVFGRFREAARAAQPWRLLDSRRGAGRRVGLGDGCVDLVPYDFIRFVAGNRIK